MVILISDEIDNFTHYEDFFIAAKPGSRFINQTFEELGAIIATGHLTYYKLQYSSLRTQLMNSLVVLDLTRTLIQ